VSTDRDDRRGASAPRSVALFIDWDNFAIGLRQEMPDRAADVGPILRWSRRFGVLTVCRAYGEWRDPAERLAIYNAGVEVVYAPVLPLGGSVMARNGGGAKSLADTAMAVDVTELLNLMPSITTVILATSDKDLIPVLRFAQRRGLQAIVVGSDRTASALRDLADEFISYRQLLDQEGGVTSPVSRPVTVPAVRYPRAPRFGGVLPPPAAADGIDDPPRRVRAAVTRTPIVTRAPAAPAAPELARPLPSPAFAAGEDAADDDDEGGDAAARRRRRGGRRRRGREVNGAEVPAGAQADGDEATDGDPTSGAVSVDPGELAAIGPQAVEEAEAEAAGPPPEQLAPQTGIGAPHGLNASVEHPTEQASPGTVMPTDRGRQTAQDRPTAPPPGRVPVVLPGERLRKLSSAPVPAEEPRPAVVTQEAPPLPPSPEQAEQPAGVSETAPNSETSEDGAEASAAGAASRSRARRGGRAGGRATSAAKSAGAVKSATPDEAPAATDVAASPPEPAVGEDSDAASSESEPASRTASGARPRRRGGRGR